MKVLTDNQYYGQIADVIREQNGTSNTYTPPQMVRALKDLFYEEVEGVPPITFQGIGENLLDYRIDGASGGVGDRTGNLFDEILDFNKTLNPQGNSEIYSGRYCCHNSIDVSNISSCTISWKSKKNSALIYALFDNNNQLLSRDFGYVNPFNLITNNAMFLKIGFLNKNESIQKLELHDIYDVMVNEGSEALPYEPYGYKVPVVVSSKNFLQNTATTQTINGVTFTVNNDKSITCNGTATGTAAITINTIFSINSTKISGCPMGGSWSSFELDLLNINTNNVDVIDTGNGAVIQNENSYRVRIRIASGYTCNNLTFYPMIRKADIEDDTYEPYIEPTTTNIYRDEPIEAKANIPSEYEEVEYIESTGTQYIDTGINVNTTTSRYETKINPSSVSGTMGIFGTRNNSMASQSSMNVFIIGGTFRLDWLSGNGNYNVRNISTNTEYTISITRGLATINNVNYTSGETISIDSLYPFYVGSFNNVGSVFSTGFSGKIYYSKLYNNNILVFDGVPCYRKSDNEIGMYDLVSNTFFTNAGTGNFIVGPIKENESISLSDTNTNIPTIRGTNVLSIDTTVQPSNVYVKSRHETSYEAAMRERYEEAQAQLDALESGGE